LTLKFGVFSVYNKLTFFPNRLFFTNLFFYLHEDDLLDLFFIIWTLSGEFYSLILGKLIVELAPHPILVLKPLIVLNFK